MAEENRGTDFGGPMSAIAALKLMGWDGFTPQPVAGLIMDLARQLLVQGHSLSNTTQMLRNIADIFPDYIADVSPELADDDEDEDGDEMAVHDSRR